MFFFTSHAPKAAGNRGQRQRGSGYCDFCRPGGYLNPLEGLPDEIS